MKKKLVSLLLVTAMSVTALSGCGSKADGTEGSKKEDKKEAQSITFMAPDWAVPTDEQLDEFTKETGIEVVVNEVGWDDIREKMVTAAAGGQAVADVVEVDWSWVGEFYAADWLEPLDVSDEVKADMPTLETFTKDGKVLAIPYANDYRLSYYNTEQFEKAGITEEPQTWEDVLEACRTLKSTGTVEHPFAIALNAEEKNNDLLDVACIYDEWCCL